MTKLIETEKIQKAHEFANRKLSLIKRLAGDTFFDHTRRVYEILIQGEVAEETTLVSALLHNIELTEPIQKEILELFGEDVLMILKSYQKLANLTIDNTNPTNEAYAIQAFIKTSGDMRVIAVRIADKIDNVNTSLALGKDQRIASCNKALFFYAPLAKLLGLGLLASQLEDAAFKVLYPGEFYKIDKHLARKEPTLLSSMQEAVTFINDILSENGIESQITCRVKRRYSIFKKLLHYGKTLTNLNQDIKGIYDLAAMRIVVNTIEECYLVEGLLCDLWDRIEHLRDDYIAVPRKAGYQSIHNIFKIGRGMNLEIQIRTHEMHKFSEYGPASHLLYKIGDKGAASLAYKKFMEYTKKNAFWFEELVAWKREDTGFDISSKIPFSKNIYTFTPKRDIVELPKGACLLDFAYALHTDLGNRCIGGFVNKKYVGLDHVLQDGDFVEIKQGPKVNANRDWLKLVRTSRAKECIRKALRAAGGHGAF